MGINLVTFAAQTVTPQDDALIYETALQESGMIYGGAVTIKSANVLHVAAGHGALCGRKFTIEETDVAVGLTPSGSLLGRIYIHMDLSDTGEPISFQTETANSLTPVIQQSDVNINNGVYEINLATFTVDTSTISNLVNVAPFIDISPDSKFSASSNNPLMNKAITKAIGDPETIGGSASQPYTKGALLLATDGQIYEVTQNIALHGSIVNGGNVSPTGNIISQISNLANQSYKLDTTGFTSWTDSYWHEIPCDGYVTITFDNAQGRYAWLQIENTNRDVLNVSSPPNAGLYSTPYLALFIRKGLKVKLGGTTDHRTAYFYPLMPI